MFYSDQSLWPLGLCVLKGTQSLEDHEKMLDAWNQWFKREEKFIALRVYLDDDALDQVEGTAKRTKIWLRESAGELIRQRISAMVNIVPHSSYEKMKHMSVERVFGIPGGVFNNLNEALQWLENNSLTRQYSQINHGSLSQIIEKNSQNIEQIS